MPRRRKKLPLEGKVISVPWISVYGLSVAIGLAPEPHLAPLVEAGRPVVAVVAVDVLNKKGAK